MTARFFHRACHLLIEAIGARKSDPAHVELFGDHQLTEAQNVLFHHGERIVIELNFTHPISSVEVLDLFNDALGAAAAQSGHCRIAESALARAPACHQHIDCGQALIGADGGVVLVHRHQVVRRKRILIEVHLHSAAGIMNHRGSLSIGNAPDGLQGLALKNRKKSLLAVATYDDVDRGVA